MAEQSTFIKIDRNMKRWRWFKNTKTLIVFLWLLLEANVVDHEFEHEIIHRGEVATSLKTIGNSTGLTIQEVRTAILHLKSTGEITSRQRHKYQVISITNYCDYQDVQHGKQHKPQHSFNRQSTGNQQQYKNDKNGKNGKNKKGDRSAPPNPPSGGKEPDRDDGGYEDIPVKHRDGTYHSFETYQEYWDWRNQ